MEYFAAGGALYDDPLALAYLEQGDPGEHDDLVRRCVRFGIADQSSYPLAVTRSVSTVPSVLCAAGRGVRWVDCAAGAGDRSSGV